MGNKRQTGRKGVKWVENKGKWSTAEDNKLREAVQPMHQPTIRYSEGHHYHWTTAAEFVKTRSPKQCRERWQNYLDPTLDHSAFTEEEKDFIMEQAEEIGTCWARIRRMMTRNRSESKIKNFWYSKTRKLLTEDKQATSNPSSTSDSRPSTAGTGLTTSSSLSSTMPLQTPLRQPDHYQGGCPYQPTHRQPEQYQGRYPYQPPHHQPNQHHRGQPLYATPPLTHQPYDYPNPDPSYSNVPDPSRGFGHTHEGSHEQPHYSLSSSATALTMALTPQVSPSNHAMRLASPAYSIMRYDRPYREAENHPQKSFPPRLPPIRSLLQTELQSPLQSPPQSPSRPRLPTPEVLRRQRQYGYM